MKARSYVFQAIVGLVLVAVIVVCFVLAVKADKGDDSESAADASVTERRIVPGYVIGDSYTAGTALGGAGSNNWTQVLERKLRSENVDLQLRPIAAPGSGYVTPGPTDVTFVDEAQGVGGDGQVVIVFGSRNDLPSADEVGAAADKTLDLVSERAPSAAIVVVGAHFAGANPPDGIAKINAQLRSVAARHRATFVDPSGWLQDPKLIGSDKVHPNDLGHAEIADRLAPTLATVIAQIKQEQLNSG
ncbi:SGNH/GDSL hydrolase family protein [Gordonia sp. NPDC003429]